MPINPYGVVKGRVLRYEAERLDDQSPHMHVFVEAAGRTLKAAVNVKSRANPSEVAYLNRDEYQHPHLARYLTFAAGVTELPKNGTSGAIDYIRGNPFPFETMIALPHNLPGVDDDLLDRLASQLDRAVLRSAVTDIYLFGELFDGGVHSIHMNQGNVEPFERDNGVWQDGALILHDRELDRWTALFLAFQSQSVHTNDSTGASLPGSPRLADVLRGAPVPVPVPSPTPAPVPAPTPGQPTPAAATLRLVAALVNPRGPEDRTGGETVTLINLGPAETLLESWTLAASRTARMPLSGTIAAGETRRIAAARSLPLSNQGGILSLLDPQGLKVDGVAYTREQARTEGMTLLFSR